MADNDPKCTRCKNNPPKWADKLYKMQQLCDSCWLWMYGEALKNRHSEWFIANYPNYRTVLPESVLIALGLNDGQ